MKLIERTLFALVLAGIVLAVTGPIWSKSRMSRVNILGQQAIEMKVADPSNNPEQYKRDAEAKANITTEVFKLANIARHGMTLAYIGILLSVSSLAALCVCLKKDVNALKRREDAQPRN